MKLINTTMTSQRKFKNQRRNKRYYKPLKRVFTPKILRVIEPLEIIYKIRRFRLPKTNITKISIKQRIYDLRKSREEKVTVFLLLLQT